MTERDPMSSESGIIEALADEDAAKETAAASKSPKRQRDDALPTDGDEELDDTEAGSDR